VADEFVLSSFSFGFS